jgi:O-antigen ligase
MSIFTDSLPGKLWSVLKRADPHSVPARLGRVLRSAWRASAFKRYWEGSAARTFPPAKNPGGESPHPVWESSAFNRIAAWGKAKGGRLLGSALRFGVKRWALLAMACMLPLDIFFRQTLRGTPLGFMGSLWDKLFWAALLFYVLWRRAMARKRIFTKPTLAAEAAIWLYLGAGLFLMLANAPNLRIAFDGLRAQVFFVPMFFVAHRLIDDEGDLLSFVIPFAAIGGLVSLHGVYQYIVGTPIPAAWVSQTEMGVRTRAFSILGSPNVMASFLVMTAPLAVALVYMTSQWLTGRPNWRRAAIRLVLWGAGGAMCLACLLTFSRGGWLGMAAAIMVFALLRDRRLFLLLALVTAVAVFIPEIANRVTYLFTADFAEASQRAGRAVRWQVGWDLLRRSNAWLGFGLGRFGGAVAMQNQVVENLRYFYMDNYYLKTLVEMGWIGLGCYLFLLAATVIAGLKAYTAVYGDPRLRAMAAALLAGLCGVLVHCYFENIFEVPYMLAYFWMMAGALMALPRLKHTVNHA